MNGWQFWTEEFGATRAQFSGFQNDLYSAVLPVPPGIAFLKTGRHISYQTLTLVYVVAASTFELTEAITKACALPTR